MRTVLDMLSERHAAVAKVVPDRPGIPGRAIGGQQLAHKLVVGLVLAQEVLDELRVVGRDQLAVVGGAVHAEDVGPVIEPVVHVAFARQQVADQFLRLVGILRGEVSLGFGLRRDAARRCRGKGGAPSLVGAGSFGVTSWAA